MPKLCAIDIGSNAIRFSVAQHSPDGLETVDYLRVPVRLGADAFAEGRLSPTTLQAAEHAFVLFAEKLALHKPDAIRAVATSALREADNRTQLIERVRRRTGIRIELISGEEEARLVFLAVSRVLDLSGANVVLIDIGGGSVEISMARHGYIEIAESFDLGTVRLLNTLRDQQANRKTFHRLLDEVAGNAVETMRTMINGNKIDFAVGTGGNIEALGKLAADRLDGTAANMLSSKHLAKLVDLLKGMDVDQRISELDLRPDRADVIFPAGVVLARVLKTFGIETTRIPGVGVKDGVLWQLLDEARGSREILGSKHILPSARRLAKKFGTDLTHAETVAGFALQLFDVLAPVHQLEARSRLLLHCAAILHDIGKVVSIHGHHKHTLYLLRNTLIVGLSRREREIVAHTARYHRKSLPKPSHLEFQSLPDEDRDLVGMLGGILRVANAMDAEHGHLIQDAEMHYADGVLHLGIRGSGDLLIEEWAMRRRAEMLEQALGIEVVVEREGGGAP